MSSLSKEAREVLEAGVRAEAPTMADRQRARARLEVTLAASVAGGPDQAPPLSPAPAPKPWVMKGVVVGTAAVLVVAAGTVAVWPSSSTSTSASTPEVVERSPRLATPATPTPTPTPTPAPTPTRRRSGSAPAAPLAPLAPLAAPDAEGPETLEAETQALRQVQGALKEGDAPWALRLLAEQDLRFHRGQLGPERQAARVLALCAIDLTAGRAALAEFLKAHPTSPLLPRVKSACSP